jgi:hypothetical protein
MSHGQLGASALLPQQVLIWRRRRPRHVQATEPTALLGSSAAWDELLALNPGPTSKTSCVTSTLTLSFSHCSSDSGSDTSQREVDLEPLVGTTCE